MVHKVVTIIGDIYNLLWVQVGMYWAYMTIEVVGLLLVKDPQLQLAISCVDTAYTVLLPFCILDGMRIPWHIVEVDSICGSILYSSQVSFDEGKFDSTPSKWSGMDIPVFGSWIEWDDVGLNCQGASFTNKPFTHSWLGLRSVCFRWSPKYRASW